MTHKEWVDWCEYSTVEPFGFPGWDELNAQLCVVLAAAQGVENVSLEEFSRRREDDDEHLELTVEEQRTQTMHLFGGVAKVVQAPPAEVSAPGQKMAGNGEGS